MANTSILAAFERMWQHVLIVINNKADVSYVDEGISNIVEEVKNDATNKDIVVLSEAQKIAKEYTDTVAETKATVQIITWGADD